LLIDFKVGNWQFVLTHPDQFSGTRPWLHPMQPGLFFEQHPLSSIDVRFDVGSNGFSVYRADGVADASWADASGTNSMQNVLPRTKPTLPESSKNADAQPVAEIEGLIRDFAGGGAKNAGSADTSEIAVNADILVRRTITLDELKNVIEELDQLYDFMHSEGQRLEREISEYAQLSDSTVSATRIIADNMLQWKKSEANKG
jgi:hypothetical protein